MAVYGRDLAHVAEWCLHSLLAQGLINGDEHQLENRRAVRGRC